MFPVCSPCHSSYFPLSFRLTCCHWIATKAWQQLCEIWTMSTQAFTRHWSRVKGFERHEHYPILGHMMWRARNQIFHDLDYFVPLHQSWTDLPRSPGTLFTPTDVTQIFIHPTGRGPISSPDSQVWRATPWIKGTLQRQQEPHDLALFKSHA